MSNTTSSAPSRRLVSIVVLVVLIEGCATDSVVRREMVPVDRGAQECDSDWDGALLGAAIGISPLVYSVFTVGEGDGVPLGFKLGFVGGVAGFWAGLAIDSRNCDEPT